MMNEYVFAGVFYDQTLQECPICKGINLTRYPLSNPEDFYLVICQEDNCRAESYDGYLNKTKEEYCE